ncbi:hypothetical protein R6258_06765 [Halomonas sp. HP20-15]|uniref:hypothetical protein n=1 Tax=Halomonas sp. HP20-15 TaxID=3085901 RepID=UPI0029818D91|nr:hypothetical protein [Halomonas sp. HP20-15]MDW5376617.1 hypothetical protein [Halomonas sp. HP20-15]
MDGKIITFDDAAQEGVIDAQDGNHYAFGLNDWRGRGMPGPGAAVRFEVREARALQVMNRPESQRRPQRAVIPSANRYPAVPLAALSVAILTAIAGLWLGLLALLLALAATGLAVAALHRLRRDDRDLRGRQLGWVALGIAALAATLCLLVKPPITSPLLPDLHSQSQAIVTPGVTQAG